MEGDDKAPWEHSLRRSILPIIIELLLLLSLKQTRVGISRLQQEAATLHRVVSGLLRLLMKNPNFIAIALLWVHEYYAVIPPYRITRNETISFQTVRGLRRAASSFHRLDIQNRAQRVIAVRHCSPTDEHSYTMMF